MTFDPLLLDMVALLGLGSAGQRTARLGTVVRARSDAPGVTSRRGAQGHHDAMTFQDVVSDVVEVVEAVGVAIMVLGGTAAFVHAVVLTSRPATRSDAYDTLRRTLGRAILLGLEVLIVADLVRTVVVDSTFESVAVLGVIVAIRVVLSFALEVEIDGMWPWARWRAAGRTPAEDADAS
jgi:uncharacterized membrane protein